MAKNTKHIGLLLLRLLNYICLFVCFTSVLEKMASAWIGARERDTECLLVSPQGARPVLHPKPREVPQAAVLGSGARREPPMLSASGYGSPPRLIVRTLGRCPTSSRISTVHYPHAPGAAPPLPRALPGALNNDICMQGAIHKYVRAGEI